MTTEKTVTVASASVRHAKLDCSHVSIVIGAENRKTELFNACKSCATTCVRLNENRLKAMPHAQVRLLNNKCILRVHQWDTCMHACERDMCVHRAHLFQLHAGIDVFALFCCCRRDVVVQIQFDVSSSCHTYSSEVK